MTSDKAYFYNSDNNGLVGGPSSKLVASAMKSGRGNHTFMTFKTKSTVACLCGVQLVKNSTLFRCRWDNSASVLSIVSFLQRLNDLLLFSVVANVMNFDK